MDFLDRSWNAAVQQVVKQPCKVPTEPFCGYSSSSDLGRDRWRGEVGPTGTLEADRRANCGVAYSTKIRRTVNKVVDVLVPQNDVLEALQFQLLAISQKDQRKRCVVESGKEEFFTDAHELKKRFDECNTKD